MTTQEANRLLSADRAVIWAKRLKPLDFLGTLVRATGGDTDSTSLDFPNALAVIDPDDTDFAWVISERRKILVFHFSEYSIDQYVLGELCITSDGVTPMKALVNHSDLWDAAGEQTVELGQDSLEITFLPYGAATIRERDTRNSEQPQHLRVSDLDVFVSSLYQLQCCQGMAPDPWIPIEVGLPEIEWKLNLYSEERGVFQGSYHGFHGCETVYRCAEGRCTTDCDPRVARHRWMSSFECGESEVSDVSQWTPLLHHPGSRPPSGPMR